MLNSKTEALGIIFPNSYDAMVPDLVSERLMASIPFASRYRMCDFILSSMVHSGIDNISIIVRKNYHSLLDHLGAGREWDLVRKNGGLNIVPPFAQKQVKVFEGRIEALESLRGYLLKQPQKYVIMTDANIAINFDFNELLDAHIKSGADVTMMYRKQEIPKAFIRQSRDRMDLSHAPKSCLPYQSGKSVPVQCRSRSARLQKLRRHFHKQTDKVCRDPVQRPVLKTPRTMRLLRV